MPYTTLALDRNHDSTERHAPNYHNGKFYNTRPMRRMGVLESLGVMWRFAFHKPANTVPRGQVPVQRLTRADLMAAPDQTLFRLGHSTMLLKLRNGFWLTDPVFSERASPVQWAGPARFHAPPISIAELPPIQGVILSHNHYDHLDKAAILALAARTEHFLAPLGVGDTLIRWGVGAAKVQQFAWWEETVVRGIRFVATPARHFSGRGLGDANASLWCSWVIEQPGLRLFFSGDSGYFEGFREIGARFGGFDLAMVETGAYNQQWPDVHMQPEETLQAHLDLGGRVLMPIHNGTFDLSMHGWTEPFERISTLAAAAGVALATPAMGEPVALAAAAGGRAWWREVD
ncbi:MBL fold metallo-hydrolase [Massilia sp. TS11]|uniref:MBL fold metallo-hydrolase n=1 Tax=Massilia sp. TS11 TaxID=2908003 RepID=UPI001EDBF8C3|nr:MBL fold metallo-hydrolase [Massilia sp. TS11]MCG2585795.1 MBL fold metallo-hydrolase [Massilia sp. TS11]